MPLRSLARSSALLLPAEESPRSSSPSSSAAAAAASARLRAPPPPPPTAPDAPARSAPPLPTAAAASAAIQPRWTTGPVAVLAGDTRQLGPKVRSPAAAPLLGLGSSLLELWLDRHARDEEKAAAGTTVGAGTLTTSPSPSAPAPATSMLVRNYRSSAALLALPNRLFYGGALVASASAPTSTTVGRIEGDFSALDPPRWDAARAVSGWTRRSESKKTKKKNKKEVGVAANGNVDLDDGSDDDDDGSSSSSRDLASAATLFVGVRGEIVTPGGGGESAYNPTEAAVVAAVVAELCRRRGSESGVNPSDVGVICLTRQQARTCRSMLRSRARSAAAAAAGPAVAALGLGSVRVGTVDDYQGQEVDVVVVSTVAAVPPSLPHSSSNASSSSPTSPPPPPPFRLPAPLREALSDPRVFNVAVTRARRLLVVVGCPVALLRGPTPASSSASTSSQPPLNPWLELLRHVAGRNAYLGCGSDALVEAVGSSSREYRRPASAAASGGKQQQHSNKDGGDDDDELSAAAARVAELALLGSGWACESFPSSLDDLEESLGGGGGGRARLVL